MINIDNLPKPDVMQVLDYETILNQNINNFKILVPDWIALESDKYKLILEAFAYRELHLRAEFNNLASAFFLLTAKGADLENHAASYGLERLKGSSPYADYEFELSEALIQDVAVPAGLILTDASSEVQSKLLNAVTIKAGETKATGIVELQVKTPTSDYKTEIITTPMPFVLGVKALSAFGNGSTSENDEELKERVLLSISNKSTAGSEESYKSFTYSSDERIDDVAVLNGGAGVVNVFYYSENADSLMQQRIEEMLNKDDIRPLSDNVVVSEATPISYSVTAHLYLLPNQEVATIYSNAINSLNVNLAALKKIGVIITLSEINDFLKVDGVKEVVLTLPSSNVSIDTNEIGVNGANIITYSII